VLGAVAARVVSVEIIPELADVARGTLQRCGLDRNVLIVTATPRAGGPSMLPMTLSRWPRRPPTSPPACWPNSRTLEDSSSGGLHVGPELRVVVKSQGAIHSRLATYCRFVPSAGSGLGIERRSVLPQVVDVYRVTHLVQPAELTEPLVPPGLDVDILQYCRRHGRDAVHVRAAHLRPRWGNRLGSNAVVLRNRASKIEEAEPWLAMAIQPSLEVPQVLAPVQVRIDQVPGSLIRSTRNRC